MNRLTFLLVIAAGSLLGAAARGADEQPAAPAEFKVHPIGRIKVAEGRSWIVLDKQYQPGLLGLDGFSHIHVIWWFHQNDTPQRRAILQVHPRGNPQNPLTGVFATRSPVRPNLIGLTLCRVLEVKENVIEIDRTDAFDGTPVLDIKPFTPGPDSASDVRVPAWTRN